MAAPRNWWSKHFLAVEFGLGLLLSAAFAVWVLWAGGDQVLNTELDTRRGTIYGALASIFGALLGFAITAQSILLALSDNERLEVVRESPHYETLWRVFTEAVRWLGIATFAAVVALIADRDAAPKIAALLFVATASVIASIRLVRLIWALENVVGLVSGPRKARRGDE